MDAVYTGLIRLLQPVDFSMRRLRLLEDIIEREEGGLDADIPCDEMRGLLSWEMDALSKAKAQLQAATSSAARKVVTSNTAAQREEVERLRGELDFLATRYETATDLQHALSSPHTPIWLRSLFDLYRQEQMDWLLSHTQSPALSALISQHGQLIKALRPLLTATSKAAAPLTCRQLCGHTRQCMDALQKVVVGLSGKGATWREWEAALRIEPLTAFTSLQELAGELRKRLSNLPLRLDEEASKASSLLSADANDSAMEGDRPSTGEVKEDAGDSHHQLHVAQSEFALQALRRAGEKLAGIEPAYTRRDGERDLGEEGRDREVTTPLSVRDHVAWLIEEATRVDHLCRMYEGWAPWI